MGGNSWVYHNDNAMIIDLIYVLIAVVMNIILMPLEALSKGFSMIPNIPGLMAWLIHPLWYFQGILDVYTLLFAMTVIITYFEVMLSIRFFFWIASALPFLSNLRNPFAKTWSRENYGSEQVRRDSKGRVVWTQKYVGKRSRWNEIVDATEDRLKR